MSKIEWLKRPRTSMIAMIIGIIIGIFFKDISNLLAPFGNLYLSFLKMLVIPIMVTAVITSLGKLLASNEAAHYLKRMCVTFLTGLLLVSLLGISMGLIGEPGANLDQEAREVLGSTIMDEEGQLLEETPSQSSFAAMDFLEMLIPTNIFQALAGDQSLQVLFVSIIFGVALGTIKGEKRDDVLNFFEITYKTFEKIIMWTMYGLPFGLLCIIANQFSTMGMEMLQSMTIFIFLIYLSSFLLMGLSAAIIWKYKKRTPIQSTKDLKEPLLIAFGTRNSLATMPSIFQVLETRYQLKEEAVNLIVPLSIIICRYSMVLVFSIGTIFISQLYEIELSVMQYAVIVIGSIFAAVAGAGAPVLVSVSMFALVLAPLGLPSETAIVLLLAVIPIIDPVLTMLNVHLTCTSSILIDRPDFNENEDDLGESLDQTQVI